MKTFLFKIGLMFCIIIFLLFIITVLNWSLLRYSDNFSLEKKINILILGDSHTRYSLDDNILTNTFNFSQDADSYFYSFQKLKLITAKNEQIDTVFISYSQHNIHKCIEDRWLLNNGHLKNRLKFYLPLLDSDDWLFFLRNKPAEFIPGLFSQIQFPYYFLKKPNPYGGFDHMENNILEKEIEEQKKNGIREEYKSFTESNIETDYLKKIIEYCNLRNISVILINTPIFETLQMEQNDLYQFYSMNLSNTLFYDFSKIEMKDSYFGDLVHLSPSGSKYFSELIEKEQLFNIKNAEKYNIKFKK